MRLTSVLIAAWALSAGCGPVRMQTESALPLCRSVLPANGPSVRWIAPFDAGDRKNIRSWCDAVGPVAVHDPGTVQVRRDRPLTVVSWNMAVGEGNLVDLLGEVRGAQADANVILILQEAYRAGSPPRECPPGSGRAGALGLPRPSGSEDILELAKRVGMHAVYAPSMRNGQDCALEPREDRGNAILSTLPLSSITAVELPFAQQRRVAVAAVVRDGDRSIGVLTTHFDTFRGHKRMAQAIAQTVAILGWTDPFVIGGDFNSGLPFDAGVREMRKHFTELDCGEGPTHKLGSRLDHIFIASASQPFPCRTGGDRHGSDHSPLIARLP